MKNKILCTILESGTVKVETDEIASADHRIAEAALQWIKEQLGGESERVNRVHHHEHNHEHHHDHLEH